jgi:hyperosmotically inducible periplasmic protein
VRELLNLIDIFSHSSIPGELSEMTIRASNIFETFMAGFAAIAIGVIPTYAQSPANHAADNSAQNQSDRNNNTLTPMDQSNKPEDLNITRQLRKSIVDDKSLSTDAKNIKIITVDGKVTLRGPVSNEQERTDIAAKAGQIAGAANVNNELQVKAE